MQDGSARKMLLVLILLVEAGLSAVCFFCWTPPKHAAVRLPLPTSRADLEPPKGLYFEIGLGLGSGWLSTYEYEVETDLTKPAQFFVQTGPAHRRTSRFLASRSIVSESM